MKHVCGNISYMYISYMYRGLAYFENGPFIDLSQSHESCETKAAEDY